MRVLGMAFLLLVPLAIGCGRTPTDAGSAGSGGGDLPGGSGGDETGGGGSGGGGSGGSGGVGGDGGTGGEGGVICLAASARAMASREPVILHRDGAELFRVHGAFAAPRDGAEAAARAVLSGFAPDVGLAADGSDLELRLEKRGLLGRYLRFGQTVGGLPVFDREVVVHVVEHEGVTEVRDLVFAHARLGDFAPKAPVLEAAGAIERAHGALGLVASPSLGSEATLGVRVDDDGATLAFRVEVSPDDPVGSFFVFVDAIDGRVLEVRDRLQHVDGTGLVFDPNPMASSGDTTLEDRDDQTSPTLDAARYRVVLPRLDGSGYLRGDWVDARSGGGSSRTIREDLVFDFDRSQAGFEETNVYFHLDRMQQRLQALGFTDVNARRQGVYANGSSEENSWFDPRTKWITTGTGGVDDGEDADVVLHEYGHACLDNLVPYFGQNDEAGAIGEGFGDYLAGSYAAALTQQILDPACVGEWDGAAFIAADPPCMRRLDGTKHFPEHLEYEVHADGEIWSAALWKLREALGGDAADRLIIESTLSYTAGERFAAASAALLDADRNLTGGRNLATIQRVLFRFGLLRTPTPPATFPDVLSSVTVSVENRRYGGRYENWADEWREIRQPGAAALRLHFERIETEQDSGCLGGACDNVYLYDGAGHLFQILNGQATDVTSVTIPGEVVQLRLVTDPWVALYGYKVDRVDVMGYRTCGNGVVDAGEGCDGADLAGATCEGLGFGPGPLACRPDCTLDASDCPGAAGCGDGFAGPGEECDGADLDGASCASLGHGAGTLTCTGGCRLDASGCHTCGDGVREGAEACDGADLGSVTCEQLGAGTGTPLCSAACTFDTSTCEPPC